MKNLLLYINPRKSFGHRRNYRDLKEAEINIDNSLHFWDKDDIILATNFPFEYHGVKAIEVPDSLHCHIKDQTSKVNAIIYLLEQGVLNELTWFHDLDAFQLQPIKEFRLEKDIGFTDYGYIDKWNTGSIWFKPSALEAFRWLRDAVYALDTDEERALGALTTDADHPINTRFEKLNITWNLGMRHIDHNMSIADKPLMVAHFHPNKRDLTKVFTPLLPERLVNLIREKFTDLP